MIYISIYKWEVVGIMPTFLGWGDRRRFVGVHPPFGPQSELDPLPCPSPWNCRCSAPRSLAPFGAFKNRLRRKMKILKPSHFFDQKMSPVELWPIQDLPKRAPMDAARMPGAPFEATGAPNVRLGALPGPPQNPGRPNFEPTLSSAGNR